MKPKKPNKQPVIPPTDRDADLSVYVSSTAALARTLGLSPKSVEAWTRRAECPRKHATKGWNVISFARWLFKHRGTDQSKERSEASLMERKAKARIAKAKAILEMARARRELGRFVDKEQARQLRLRLIRAFVSVCDAAPSELSALLKLVGNEKRAAMKTCTDWFNGKRNELVNEFSEKDA